MTETTESTGRPKKRSGGLNSMLLADLKAMAGGMGIAGASGMKKAQLVDAIKAVQAGQSGQATLEVDVPPAQEPAAEEPAAKEQKAAGRKAEQPTADDAGKAQPRRQRQAPQDKQQDKQQDAQQDRAHEKAQEKAPEKQGRQGGNQGNQGNQQNRQQGNQQGNQQGQPKDKQDKQDKQDQGRPDQQAKQDRQDQNRPDRNRQDQNRDQDRQDQNSGIDDADDDGEEGGSRRNRRRRGRDRATRAGREPDTTILEDDVVVPAAGILDVLDNYAFVRTTGYLAGSDDVYLSLSMVRKYALRRGDAIVGQVRHPREGERREKFNPMVRIDTVNGVDSEQAKNRPDFGALTPVSPTERLRMETAPDNLTGRVIDITAPVGKGQRGIIVSPARAGKTAMLQSLATSITTNNPECHLMVVLIDERPEEVTDFQRAVKGEVIASTFDRAPVDHTTVAELALERAKRLVELGHDVVVLLDGLTRLGRAYNLAMPASGRILAGGLDAAAIYPTKKFVGAARNIEDGGSLTILATATADSASTMDEVIFEELRDTGNLEIRLRRELAEKRTFPAIDPVASGTRREELLLGAEELAIVDRLRRSLATEETTQAAERLLDGLRKTRTNIEYLGQVR